MVRTKTQLGNFHWKVLDYPPEGLDFVPSGIHLFPKPMEFSVGKCWHIEKKKVTDWLSSQVTEFSLMRESKVTHPKADVCHDLKIV